MVGIGLALAHAVRSPGVSSAWRWGVSGVAVAVVILAYQEFRSRRRFEGMWFGLLAGALFVWAGAGLSYRALVLICALWLGAMIVVGLVSPKVTLQSPIGLKSRKMGDGLTVGAGVPDAGLQAAPASGTILSEPYIKGQTIRMVDLAPAFPDPPLVKDRTFEDCLFVGPAVMGIVTGNLLSPTFLVADASKPEELFIESKGDRTYYGVIGFDSCTFLRCRFFRIGFLAPAEKIAEALAQSAAHDSDEDG